MHSQETARTNVTKTRNQKLSIGEATITRQNKNT